MRLFVFEMFCFLACTKSTALVSFADSFLVVLLDWIDLKIKQERAKQKHAVVVESFYLCFSYSSLFECLLSCDSVI